MSPAGGGGKKETCPEITSEWWGTFGPVRGGRRPLVKRDCAGLAKAQPNPCYGSIKKVENPHAVRAFVTSLLERRPAAGTRNEIGGRRAGNWTHMRSTLLVKRKYSIYGTVRCTSIPPKRNRGHERDETQLASNGSVPTKVAPKLHVTVHVWCARRCATKGSSRSSRQHTLRVLLGVACLENVF